MHLQIHVPRQVIIAHRRSIVKKQNIVNLEYLSQQWPLLKARPGILLACLLVLLSDVRERDCCSLSSVQKWRHPYTGILLPHLWLGTRISRKSCECQFLSDDYSDYKQLGWMFNLKETKIMSHDSNQTSNQIYVSKEKQYETSLVFHFSFKRQSFKE